MNKFECKTIIFNSATKANFKNIHMCIEAISLHFLVDIIANDMIIYTSFSCLIRFWFMTTKIVLA